VLIVPTPGVCWPPLQRESAAELNALAGDVGAHLATLRAALYPLLVSSDISLGRATTRNSVMGRNGPDLDGSLANARVAMESAKAIESQLALMEARLAQAQERFDVDAPLEMAEVDVCKIVEDTTSILASRPAGTRSRGDRVDMFSLLRLPEWEFKVQAKAIELMQCLMTLAETVSEKL